MSRRDRRAVGRRSILRDLVDRKSFSDREKAAVLLYERDLEKAEIAGTPRSSLAETSLAAIGSGDRSERMVATHRLEQVKRELPDSIRRMLGHIERANTTRRGSLTALPITSGLVDERQHNLVCVGMLKAMAACLADAYRVPQEREVA